MAPEILVNFFPDDWFKTDPETSENRLDGLDGTAEVEEIVGGALTLDCDGLVLVSFESIDFPLKNAIT